MFFFVVASLLLQALAIPQVFSLRVPRADDTLCVTVCDSYNNYPANCTSPTSQSCIGCTQDYVNIAAQCYDCEAYVVPDQSQQAGLIINFQIDINATVAGCMIVGFNLTTPIIVPVAPSGAPSSPTGSNAPAAASASSKSTASSTPATKSSSAMKKIPGATWAALALVGCLLSALAL